jgi:hypothetical protein
MTPEQQHEYRPTTADTGNKRYVALDAIDPKYMLMWRIDSTSALQRKEVRAE